MLLMRTLARDISIYNRESKDEFNDGKNQGWKLMHGDVFRPPKHSAWMGPLLGSGMQFLNMSMFTLAVGLLGLLSPSYRGGFISYAIALYLLSGQVFKTDACGAMADDVFMQTVHRIHKQSDTPRVEGGPQVMDTERIRGKCILLEFISATSKR